ncbi:hypothetical protein RUMTOR_02751 [[Ruminococcus] torques ATCC 27756]|uniref:Uncharacterized protein n=1 Tax=[Ruminococcus] torques ATCC 27756 TaxID=411460 RepID=A5KR59_9FIRM|nr:hypothetical protein RUMTOR_02751 [[Ruminococcus] torques ATCC 27756]
MPNSSASPHKTCIKQFRLFKKSATTSSVVTTAFV